MGACASKPNVLNGDAPEDAPENIVPNDVEVVVKEQQLNKEDIVTVHDDDADHTSSLHNLLSNEEGKGSIEEKTETLVKSSKIACEEEKKEFEVEKVVDDSPKTDATNFVIDEKKIEEVKSESPLEKVVKSSLESENKKDDQEKLSEEASGEKTIEEVKLEEKPSSSEEKKIEEKPADSEDQNSETEKKETQDKPVAIKKGMFWWDK